MSKKDVEVIQKIIEENNISYFALIQEEGSGIGYTTTLEFETTIHSRAATVTMTVTDYKDW